jgi:hypothetical protein
MEQSATVETLSTQILFFSQTKVAVVSLVRETRLRSAEVLISSTSTTLMLQPRPRQALLRAHQPDPSLSNPLVATHP